MIQDDIWHHMIGDIRYKACYEYHTTYGRDLIYNVQRLISDSEQIDVKLIEIY